MSGAIYAPARIMPDPIPYRGHGMLSRTELAAVLRVLVAVEARPQALVTMTWSNEDLDANIALSRAQYIRTEPDSGRSKFRWNRLELTEAGAVYLAQLRKAA